MAHAVDTTPVGHRLNGWTTELGKDSVAMKKIPYFFNEKIQDYDATSLKNCLYIDRFNIST